MNKYTYIDNSGYPTVKVIFECEAENILAADHLLFCELGISAKTRWLAVTIRDSTLKERIEANEFE